MVDAIVLDARLRQSLSAVRSLGRRGVSVAAVDVLCAPPAFRSRWCREQFVCPEPEATDAYVAYVDRLAQRLGAKVLIPSHDGTVAALRSHRARLEPRMRIALAGEQALTMTVDKGQTLAVAARLGLRVPRGL